MEPNQNLDKLTTPRISRNENGKLIYSEVGATKRCSVCTYGDEKNFGLAVKHSYTCPTCKGKKRLPGTRTYGGKTQRIMKRCSDCGGNGFKMYEEAIVIGTCPHCEGKLYETKVSIYDSTIREDLELLYELIDFEGTYTGAQTFNESYLGVGLCGGVTDYGRYLELSPDDFKKEVYKNFVEGHGRQYLTYMKDHDPTKLCDKIIIKKSRSGYTLYPVWDEEISSEAKLANQLWNQYAEM